VDKHEVLDAIVLAPAGLINPRDEGSENCDVPTPEKPLANSRPGTIMQALKACSAPRFEPVTLVNTGLVC
jgi:hypothetical protein